MAEPITACSSKLELDRSYSALVWGNANVGEVDGAVDSYIYMLLLGCKGSVV